MSGLLAWVVVAALGQVAHAAGVAITLDDPDVENAPRLGPDERNRAILDALDAFHAEAALFVCGKRVDSAAGRRLVQSWDERGHLIGNHGYSHRSLHARSVDAPGFWKDFERSERLLARYSHFTRLARFPALKEGNTVEKRDAMRALLARHGYHNGVVTIDASDWYINNRLVAALQRDPNADVTPYRAFYLAHLWDRAQFYDRLATQLGLSGLQHTLLIHHNLLNALFLKDVLAMFLSHGWTLVSAARAFQQPVLQSTPDTLPAGESLVWALAKATGRFDPVLRYPGEDGEYLAGDMDRLGL